MRKRLLILVGVVLAVAIVTAGTRELFRPSVPPPRFTPDMPGRIRPGMTEAEVVAILGRPAGNYASPAVCFADACPDYKSDVWSSPAGRHRPDGTTEKAWISDEGGVAVEFDAEGRVAYCYFEAMWVPRPPSVTDRVRAWLRRLWP
jgi:hypothetical protein